MPTKLFLVQSLCGVPPGTQFNRITYSGTAHYEHRVVGGGIFLIPASIATDSEEWFTELEPKGEKKSHAIGLAIDDET